MLHTQRDIYLSGENLEMLAALQSNSVSEKLVMIIDDSQTVRKIVETCLQREGFETVSFSDGIEAMRWFTLSEARFPLLIILDIRLPKMNGYDVARHFKSKVQLRDTVIIMLTRHDGVLDRLKGRLVGASGYITKPFQTQDLIEMVKAYIGVPIYQQEANGSE